MLVEQRPAAFKVPLCAVQDCKLSRKSALGVSKTWGSLLALGGLIGVADA